MTTSRTLISALQVNLDGYSSEGDAEWVDFGIESLNWRISQFLHGEQGFFFFLASVWVSPSRPSVPATVAARARRRSMG